MLFYKSFQKLSLLPTLLAPIQTLPSKIRLNSFRQYYFCTNEKNLRPKLNSWTPRIVQVEDDLQIKNLYYLINARSRELNIVLDEKKLAKQQCSPEAIKSALIQIGNCGICENQLVDITLTIQPQNLLMDMLKLSSKFFLINKIQFELRNINWQKNKIGELKLGPNEFIRAKRVKIHLNPVILNDELEFYVKLFNKFRFYNSLEIALANTQTCEFSHWDKFLKASIGNHILDSFFFSSKFLTMKNIILIDMLLDAMHPQKKFNCLKLHCHGLEEYQLTNFMRLIKKNQNLWNVAICVRKTKFVQNLTPLLHEAFSDLKKLTHINLAIKNWVIDNNQEFVEFLRNLTQTATNLKKIDFVMKFLNADEMTLLNIFELLVTPNIKLLTLAISNIEANNLVLTNSFFEKVAISIKKMPQLEIFSCNLPELNQEQTPDMTPFFDAISSQLALKNLCLSISGKIIDDNIACSLFSSIKKITKLKNLSFSIKPTVNPIGDNFIKSCISCLESLQELYALRMHINGSIDASESELIQFANVCGRFPTLRDIEIRFHNTSNLTFPFFQALAHSLKKIISLKQVSIFVKENELTKDQQLLFFSQLADIHRLLVLKICLWGKKFENDADFLVECFSRLNYLNRINIKVYNWSSEAQDYLSVRIKSLDLCGKVSVRNKIMVSNQNKVLEKDELEEREESDSDEEINN